MSTTAFGARRRTFRSSKVFRIALWCGILFCLVLFWSRSLSAYSQDHTRPNWESSRQFVSDNADEMTNIEAQPNGDEIPIGSSLNVDIAARRSNIPLRIVSYNIRYATGRPVPGEQPWSVRCPRLCTQLSFLAAGHESAFFCLQEVLHSQVQDIQRNLGDSWSHVGRGRDKDPKGGEFSPIFYRSDVWKRLRWETRWLSDTPDTPSRGWDAVLNRIATIGEFSHRTTGTRIVVMSTHFDHIGVKARMNSAKLLIQFAEEWRDGKGKDPAAAVLIGGDFNSSPEDGAYRTITGKGSGISDISDLLPEAKKYGNHLTYTSFGEPNEYPKRIDFLFIQEPRRAVVKTFGVLSNSFDDQIRISDHRPVVADLEIPL